MLGPLGSDRETIELAGEPDREVADVDHLLDFPLAFGGDLAGFQGHQAAQIALGLAEGVAETGGRLRRAWALGAAAI